MSKSYASQSALETNENSFEHYDEPDVIAEDGPVSGQSDAVLQFNGQVTGLGRQVERLAKMRGDQAHAVVELVRAHVSNAQTEDVIVATVERDSAARTIRNARRKLAKAQKDQGTIPPQIPLAGAPLEFGGFRLFMLIVVILALIISVYVENTASATILVGFEVLGLTRDSMWQARMIMLTPIAGSLTASLFLKILPIRLRKMLLVTFCFLFVASSLTWCVAFASETQRFRAEAARPFAALEDPETPELSESRMAIVLFASLSLMMLLSPMLAHSGIEVLVEQMQTKVPNPDWCTIENEICVHEKDIDIAQDQIAEAESKIAIMKARETELVTSALNLYKRLKLGAAILLAILFSGELATPCAAQPANSKADIRPAYRVLAISPRLEAADRAILKSILIRECEVMLSQPEGHVLQVLDAWTSQPIAKVENSTNSTRTRRRDTTEQLRMVLEFLKNSGGNEKFDGRVHLPRLTHSLAQLRIPPRSHVIVIGSPLFFGDGQDSVFNMVDGRYPSDGCLFDSNQNVFSTAGRSKSLESQYWHMGWNSSEMIDEAHKRCVLRFWALYLSEQSACLVTGQPAITSAIDAANKSATTKLVTDQPDRTSKPGMISNVWIVEEKSTTIRSGEPPIEDETDSTKATEDAAKREDVEQASPNVAAPAKDRLVDNPPPTMEQSNKLESNVIANVSQRDRFKNLVGSSNDLVQDRQISGKKISVLNLCGDTELDNSPLYDALKDKGFEVELLHAPLPDSTRFAKAIETTDQLWVFSSSGTSNFTDGHANAIINRWRSGKLALLLLADNDPFVYEATRLLELMSTNGQIRVSGNYRGMQYLNAGTANENGGFDRTCPLFHNVETLYEGITISSVQSSGRALKPVCWASNGKPLIATYEGNGRGRLIVHCGFTSFFSNFWTDAGVRRLAVNSAGWLSGLDQPTSQE